MKRILYIIGITLGVAFALGAVLNALNGPNGTSLDNEKQELVTLHNEIVTIANVASPGDVGQAREAHRISAAAANWADLHDAGSEWDELALSTSEFSELAAQSLERPGSVAPATLQAAGSRMQTAAAAINAR